MDDDGETTYETPMFMCFNIKIHLYLCFWLTRHRIHKILIVVDRYLRRMVDKTIPDSAEPRLESFYPPFVAGIDLPCQGVVDSYNLASISLLPNTQNCGLRMRRECQERLPRQRLQKKPLVSDPGMHHARAVMHVGIVNPRY